MITLFPLFPNAVALMTWGMVPVRWSDAGRTVPAPQWHCSAGGAASPAEEQHRREAAPISNLRGTILRALNDGSPEQ